MAAVLFKLPEVTIVDVNQAAERLLGYTKQEMVGKTSIELGIIKAEEQTEYFRKHGGQTSLHGAEQRLLTKAGEVRTAIVNTDTLTLDGQLYALSTLADITDRKRAEAALALSEERLRKAQAVSHVGSWVFHMKSNRLDLSDEMFRIFGLDKDAASGNLADILHRAIHPDDRAAFEGANRSPSPDQEPRSFEFRVVKPDGSVRTLWTEVGELRRDADGNPEMVFGISQDITERKQIEAALRRSELELRTVMDNLPGVIVRCDPQKRLRFINQVATGIGGRPLADYLGKTVFEIGLPAELAARTNANLDKVLATRQPLRMEYAIPTPAGIRHLDTYTLPQLDGNGELRSLISIGLDVTERKRMEEALQNAQKLEALALLAGGIAHDFNNLMTGVFGNVDLAIREPDRTQAKSHLAQAMNALERARALSAQLLTFAKGGAPVQKTGPLFPFVRENVQFALSGSNVLCHFYVEEGLWACSFDRNQIGQVLDNLTINAQHAMPLGGTIELRARNVRLGEGEHPVLARGDYVRLSLKDSGVGIPPELLPRIFDPFFTTKAKGHGLGLATSFSIVKRHGGYIDVESDMGKGTTFHVFLPASAAAAAKSGDAPPATHQGSGRILVMDDEVSVQGTISAMLASFGYEVLCKSNGKKAVEAFLAERRAGRGFVAVILDLTVPGGMGGKEALAEIRKHDLGVPVFVASGYSEDPVVNDPTACGFSDSIRKPFTMTELSLMLGKHLPPALSHGRIASNGLR